jgi:hypothetical protein
MPSSALKDEMGGGSQADIAITKNAKTNRIA